MQSSLNKSIQAMLKISQDLPEWNHSIKLRELQIRVIFYKKKSYKIKVIII
jgi:hypothetical protein